MSKYSNVKQLENLLNKQKIVYKYQKKKDVIYNNSIDLSNLYYKSII